MRETGSTIVKMARVPKHGCPTIPNMSATSRTARRMGMEGTSGPTAATTKATLRVGYSRAMVTTISRTWRSIILVSSRKLTWTDKEEKRGLMVRNTLDYLRKVESMDRAL